MARVTGVGGIFLRARDPKALCAWYVKHLGIKLADYGGATFLWTDEIPATTGSTTWSLFPADTTYFGSGTQQAMVNYRVDDLDELLAQLKAADVPIDPKRDDSTSAASPGSPTPRATGSSSGSLSFPPRKEGRVLK